jgi:hypothetical protein
MVQSTRDIKGTNNDTNEYEWQDYEAEHVKIIYESILHRYT